MIDQFYQLLNDISREYNLPIDILKTILVLLLNIPLSALYIVLKSSRLRVMYSLIVGIAELYFLLQFDAWYVIATTILVFFFIKLFNRSSFVVSVIFSTIALTIVHCQRFFFDYSSWKVDCSVYMMILVTKLTYYGLANQKNKYSGDLLQFFSYCFFFPSIIAGPTFSFQRYLDFINQQNEYKNIKFSFINTFKCFIMGLIVSVITAVTMPIFNHEWIIKNRQYQSYPVIGKLIAINIIGFLYRVKFYTAWYIAQVAINISGLSYSLNGKNDSVLAGSIMFQIQPNPKNKTQYWNASIQTWLKTVVYDNILKSYKNSTVALFGTFLISAFWHGVYLTYYIGFFQWAVLTHLTKFIYKASFFFSQKLRQSIVSTILAYIMASISINYIGMAIVLLQWQNMITFYSQLNYSVTIVMVALFILSFMVKTPKTYKKEKQTTKTDASVAAHTPNGQYAKQQKRQ